MYQQVGKFLVSQLDEGSKTFAVAQTWIDMTWVSQSRVGVKQNTGTEAEKLACFVKLFSPGWDSITGCCLGSYQHLH